MIVLMYLQIHGEHLFRCFKFFLSRAKMAIARTYVSVDSSIKKVITADNISP